MQDEAIASHRKGPPDATLNISDKEEPNLFGFSQGSLFHCQKLCPPGGFSQDFQIAFHRTDHPCNSFLHPLRLTH